MVARLPVSTPMIGPHRVEVRRAGEQVVAATAVGTPAPTTVDGIPAVELRSAGQDERLAVATGGSSRPLHFEADGGFGHITTRLRRVRRAGRGVGAAGLS
jgi:hypothetical protein